MKKPRITVPLESEQLEALQQLACKRTGDEGKRVSINDLLREAIKNLLSRSLDTKK